MRQYFFFIALCFFTLFTSVNLVSAANGDYAVYRDSLGTFETNVTSNTGVPFNTQTNQDAIYTQNANDIDVDLGEAGKYLFGYTVQSSGSYNNRVSWLTRVTLAGTEQLLGHGQGYRRNTGNDVYYAYGYGLVDATASDDLRVEVIREGTNDPSTHLLDADRSSFWMLKLDDTWDYLRLQGADNQSTTVAKQDINFTTSIENTDTAVFGHSTGTNPNQITLKETGHYLVVYNVGVDGATSRTSLGTNIALGGTAAQQSYDYSYVRNSNGTLSGRNSNMTIINATANDILTLEWGATGAVGTYGTTTMSNVTGISVVRLPDTAEYLRVYENTGGQTINGTTTTALIFDTQDEADSASFSYNTGSGVTTIQKDGSYLFTAGARTNRGTSGNTRLTRAGAWYVGGSRQLLGNTGMYVRGDQSTQDTFDGGWSAATIFSLSNTNTIDFRYIDEGDDGNAADALQSNSYGVTAVNVDSLFPSAVVSVSVADGVITYGGVNLSAEEDTTITGLNDTQTATNDGNVIEDFNIKTSNATTGTTWNVGSAIGSNTYVHSFSINGGSSWEILNTVDVYETLATGVSALGTQDFDLKISIPSSSSDYQQKNIIITVQAVEQ